MHDLRFAARNLLRNRGFTAIAVPARRAGRISPVVALRES